MPKKTILIVDDEVELVGMVQIRLEANNFNIITAYDGISGLEKAEIAKPDLILLDVMMPGIDGHETLRRLKASDETRSIPVIMFTAKEHMEDLEQANELGAQDYVVKPFNPAILLQKINSCLEGSS